MAVEADKVDWVRRVLGVSIAADQDPHWQPRLDVTQAEYLRVLALNPADADKMRALMGYALEHAEAGQFAKGVAALDRLDGMLAAAAPSGQAGYPGLVAYRKSLLNFRDAKAQVDHQIATLKAAIPTNLPDEQDLATELAATLGTYADDLLTAVDNAMKVAENEAAPVTQSVVTEIDGFAATVTTSELIKHVDTNPFGVSMTIEQTLAGALSAIRVAMPALAH